jgi:hypothetical protein
MYLLREIFIARENPADKNSARLIHRHLNETVPTMPQREGLRFDSKTV